METLRKLLRLLRPSKDGGWVDGKWIEGGGWIDCGNFMRRMNRNGVWEIKGAIDSESPYQRKKD